jgi:hypothetical protein
MEWNIWIPLHSAQNKLDNDDDAAEGNSYWGSLEDRQYSIELSWVCTFPAAFNYSQTANTNSTAIAGDLKDEHTTITSSPSNLGKTGMHFYVRSEYACFIYIIRFWLLILQGWWHLNSIQQELHSQFSLREQGVQRAWWKDSFLTTIENISI